MPTLYELIEADDFIQFREAVGDLLARRLNWFGVLSTPPDPLEAKRHYFWGPTLLEHAILCCRPKMIEYLHNREAVLNSTWAKTAFLTIGMQFLKNQKSLEQSTLEEISQQNNKLKTIQLLLDYGVSVNTADGNDYTLLHQAVFYKNILLLGVLLQDPHINVNGVTRFLEHPLHILPIGEESNQHHTLTIAQTLLKRDDIQLDSFDDEGNTPLHIAVLLGNIPLIHLLIQKNPELVNCYSPYEGHVTILHRATQIVESGSSPHVLTYLLPHASSKLINTEAGQNQLTPLEWAIGDYKLQTIELLLKVGAVVRPKTLELLKDLTAKQSEHVNRLLKEYHSFTRIIQHVFIIHSPYGISKAGFQW
jgi:ankyrin repeat protein